MTLMLIRLETAPTEAFPTGSAKHGYEFCVPLDRDARIDARAWRDMRRLCAVSRFWSDRPAQYGMLRQTPAGWHLDCGDAAPDEAPFFARDHRPLRPGSQVFIAEHGIQRPFRVVSVRPVGSDAVSLQAAG